MPRQNRVTPFGELVAYPERGDFFGNRGILHDHEGRLTNRRWTTHAWIICLLEFKGRRRVLMSPGTYTELFFLDEATALSAGHRPCGECRREAYRHFKACWQQGNHKPNASIKEIDRTIHAERVTHYGRRKVTFQAQINDLPDGTFIHMNENANLIWQGKLWCWTPGGYVDLIPRPQGIEVTVLTPKSIVNAIKAGYIPAVHESIR